MRDAHYARVSELRESPRRPGRYEVKLEPTGDKLPVSVEVIAELKPEVRNRRLYAYLARRGFGGVEISGVLRRLRDSGSP
jgi:hypothetical protein